MDAAVLYSFDTDHGFRTAKIHDEAGPVRPRESGIFQRPVVSDKDRAEFSDDQNGMHISPLRPSFASSLKTLQSCGFMRWKLWAKVGPERLLRRLCPRS
jgi:hypothetical protein